MAYLKQLTVGGVANLAEFGSGLTLGFSAVALPAMRSADHVPSVSDDQASWIASMITIGMPVGCLVMGPMLDRLGRRRTMMLVNAPAVLGWILIASTSHSDPWFFYQMYLGRLLTGVAVGLISSPIVVYVSEVLDKTLRGMVITWNSLCCSAGILIVYILGSIFPNNWRLVAGINALFPAATIVAIWFMIPESPVWLVSRGLYKEAELSYRRVRNVPHEDDLPEDIQQELDSIMTSAKPDDKNSSWMDTLAFLKNPEAYKPLLILNAFFFFQTFSGVYVIIMYAVTIAQETGTDVDGYFVSVLIGVARLVMSVVISCASKRFGRRFLSNTSGTAMTISGGALSVFLFLVYYGVVGPHEYTWFPAAAILLSVMAASFGFLTLPFAMMGEMFPVRIRSSACAFTSFMSKVFNFVAVKLFPEMRNMMGYHNVFTLYTVTAAIGTVLMYLYLPETQGKTLPEIEEHFKTGGKRKTDDKVEKRLLDAENIEMKDTKEKR